MIGSVKGITHKRHKNKTEFNLKSILAFGIIVASCHGNHGALALHSGISANQQGEYSGSRQAQRRDGLQNTENWIIVNMRKPNTILNPDKKFLSFLDTVEGWRTILVGDVASLDHGCKKCISLTKKESNSIEENGCLLQRAIFSAINAGANYIYMMTSLHDVKKALGRMMSSDNQRGLVFSGKSIFKPCSHFAQPLFGMNRSFGKCYDSNWMYSYTTEDFPPTDIVSSCDGCDQFSDLFPSGRVHCDSSTPNLMVKAGSFVKTTFENSLWSKNSFWAMFFHLLAEDTSQGHTKSIDPVLPLEFKFNSTVEKKLMLSFISQRLLWESGGSLGFIRSHDIYFSSQKTSSSRLQKGTVRPSYRYISRPRSNHYISTFSTSNDKNNTRQKSETYDEGKALYVTSEEIKDDNQVLDKFCVDADNENIQLKQLTQYLKGWACKEDMGVLECVRELCEELTTANFLTPKQMDVVENFLSDISTAFYIPPQRTIKDKHPLSSYTESKVNGVYFWPSLLHRMWSEHPFKSVCSKVDQQFGIFDETSPLVANPLNENVEETNLGKDGNIDQERFSSKQQLVETKLINHTNVKHHKDKKMYPGLNYFKPPLIHNIVLVIIFKINDAATQIQMAQYFDFIYGRHFKHIIYCSSGASMVKLFAKMYPQPMNYIDLKTTTASMFPYLCVSEAMKLYQDVRGYLQLDSNTLLNPWTLVSRLQDDLDKPWLPSYSHKTKLTETEVMSFIRAPVKWAVWNNVRSGRASFFRMLTELKSMTQTIMKNFKLLHLDGAETELSTENWNFDKILKYDKIGKWTKEKLKYLHRFNYVVKKFLEQLGPDVPRDATVYYGSTAIFYVPTKYRETFTLFSDEFYRFNVHADIAVHTLLMSMTSLNDIIHLNGTVARVSHTSVLLKSFSMDHVFLFPWHFFMMRSMERSKFMCQIYLPKLDSDIYTSERKLTSE